MASLIGLKMFPTHNADRKSLKSFCRRRFEGTTFTKCTKIALFSFSQYVPMREAKEGSFRTFFECPTFKTSSVK